jgi:hypothetical protein
MSETRRKRRFIYRAATEGLDKKPPFAVREAPPLQDPLRT